ncbi:hypothetical protein H1R20_g4377, partial [Candolleomyces eurysporus]
MVQVVKKVTAWTADNISAAGEPHIFWMHGYIGSGKSAVSQEVCVTSVREGRPVASFFFFRNTGKRSEIWRLATTLASQMVAVIPQTEPFVRAAVKARPALLRPDQADISLQSQMQYLVYAPFKAAVQEAAIALAGRPFLIVLDGLDQCDNKDEVKELIEGMLAFFNDNPFIPLRVFITSRVEEHIQSHLNVPGVRLDNLANHCSDDDIEIFLHILFDGVTRRNAVIQAYISQHGKWPPPNDIHKLVQHIGGSFIFASAVFKFIMWSTREGSSLATPMDRLHLALKMNPGLDGLYEQTLERSEHLPFFSDIISTIALLNAPLPTSGIAELVGISTNEVVNVLVNLGAIIVVPGTDDIPVTPFHTSLRDFLTTQSRSGRFFAHPQEHVRLFLRCLQCELVYRQHGVGSLTNRSQRSPAAAYALHYSVVHLNQAEGLFESAESDFAIQLCRRTLELNPGAPELIEQLARVQVQARSAECSTDTPQHLQLPFKLRAIGEVSDSHSDSQQTPVNHRLACFAAVDAHEHIESCQTDIVRAMGSPNTPMVVLAGFNEGLIAEDMGMLLQEIHIVSSESLTLEQHVLDAVGKACSPFPSMISMPHGKTIRPPVFNPSENGLCKIVQSYAK